MTIALTAILGGATAVVLFPVLMPWSKTLLRVSFIVWFVLWGLFFYFVHVESRSWPPENAGDPLLLGLLILLLSVSFMLRLLAQSAVQWLRRARRNYDPKPRSEGIT